jgi:hypothetical protein
MKTKIFTLLALIILCACSSKDESYKAVPAVYATANDSAENPHVIVPVPKVDIYFVIDDSNSMDVHQANLRANISRFIEKIVAEKTIDFHIGVGRIWDSGRYIPSVVPPVCSATGQVNYELNGKGGLLPVKAGDNPLFNGERFISRKEGYEKVLESSIELGIATLQKKPDATHSCPAGPEVEEVLTPILASFQPDKLSGINKGFWRADSFKVFVTLSDAQEGSDKHADEVDKEIRKWVGAPAIGTQDKYRVYAVTMVPGQVATCRPDYGFKRYPNSNSSERLKIGQIVPEHEIATLAALSGGQTLSICSNDYGDELAKFGEAIKNDTIRVLRQQIQMPDRNPELVKEKQLHLVFDFDPHNSLKEGTLIYENGRETVSGGDWAFDYKLNQVVIRGNLSAWSQHPDAQIRIIYTPVKNAADPRVKKI